MRSSGILPLLVCWMRYDSMSMFCCTSSNNGACCHSPFLLEVQQNIDMESYRIQQSSSGKIPLERRPGILDPVSTKTGYGVEPEELETLSRIIAELNDRFGLNLGPEHRVTLGQIHGEAQ